ncbi:transcriptional regulator [Paenibacillus sp. PR3]|uniref:Transcriptional regulator n=1 Tax=Paenibacillus terricola TaxID=2763503 RepID=A0ABR8MSQ3_9BACL|nr:transcriptional regulator [Paenibacillus terricola]MBD3919002.1 transcriptional regulator [Paenibacillus terricola]
MMRMKVVVVTILISGLIAGCTHARLNHTPASDTAEATLPINNNSSLNQVDDIRDKPSANSSEPSTPLELHLEGIQGHIKNIYYADENHVLISANKLYLYNLETGRTTAETSDEGFDQEWVQSVEDGYVVVGVAVDPGTQSSGLITTGVVISYSAIFYDPHLVKQSEFHFDSLLQEKEQILSLKSIAFTTDGKLVAYATTNGLYLYDFKTAQQTTITNLKSMDLEDLQARSGLVTFEQIGFTNWDKSLAFKAQSLDIPLVPDRPSFDTCGTVNIDRNNLLSNQRFENYSCKELTAYNEHVLFAEDFTKPSRKLLVMNMTNGKTKFLSMIEEGESQFVSGSDRGSYFATTLAEHTSWKVRIYDVSTGKLEDEQQIPSDGDMRYMDQDPIVRIIDERRVYIVLVGAKNIEVKTKVVVGQF